MAVSLNSVLSEIKKVQKQNDKTHQRLTNLERDMKRVLKCVSAENADFEVNIKSGGTGGKAVVPMAAKS